MVQDTRTPSGQRQRARVRFAFVRVTSTGVGSPAVSAAAVKGLSGCASCRVGPATLTHTTGGPTSQGFTVAGTPQGDYQLELLFSDRQGANFRLRPNNREVTVQAPTRATEAPRITERRHVVAFSVANANV